MLIPDAFEAQPLEAPSIKAPNIDNIDEKKRLFGIALAKGDEAFKAACVICGQNTIEALWISKNWVNDPDVIKIKLSVVEKIDTSKTLLDKDQFASMLLELASQSKIFEGKDILKALELYAEVQGFIGRNNQASVNNFVFNEMKVKLVKPEIKEKPQKVIDAVSMEPEIKPAVKIKLVS